MEKTMILFFDCETVGNWPDLETLKNDNVEFYEPWMKRDTFLRERYDTNKSISPNDLYKEKAGLQPEFSRIICVSFGKFNKDGTKQIQSFYGNEIDILKSCAGVINNAEKAGYKICGHNIKRFDIPVLWKRMLVHGINPPNSINNFGKKPWEITALDTAEIWSNGIWQESFTSLETLSILFGIKSSKNEIQANQVHEIYWNKGILDIVPYCEGDVVAQMDVFESINKIGAL